MDFNSIYARIGSGFAVRIAAAAGALYVASYAVIAVYDAFERVKGAFPL